MENQVRFKHIGRSDRLPAGVRKAITNLEGLTASFNEYNVNLAMDYGGVDELARATARMIEAGVKPEELRQRPEIIFDYLDTAGQPLPDLVIRTGNSEGEIPHTSGFMPIQTVYSSWIFSEELFPDLTPEGLLRPIQDFMTYERRQGR